MLYVDTELTSR